MVPKRYDTRLTDAIFGLADCKEAAVVSIVSTYYFPTTWSSDYNLMICLTVRDYYDRRDRLRSYSRKGRKGKINNACITYSSISCCSAKSQIWSRSSGGSLANIDISRRTVLLAEGRLGLMC